MRSFVVKESSNSVTVFWLEQDKLFEEVKTRAAKVGSLDENVTRIVLFGSLASKRAVPGSDVDLLVILKKDESRFVDRSSVWVEKFGLDFPSDVFVYTEEEAVKVPLAAEAIRSGIVLYDGLPR
jgi:predicted nucleotidyltransferase